MSSLTTVQSLAVSIFVFVFVIGILGNSFVLFVLKKKDKRLSSMETIIYFLAIVDLISSVVNPILFIYWTITDDKVWHFGNIGCHTLPVIASCSITLSLGLVLLIAIDRCRVVCHLYKNRISKKEVRCCVLLLLGIAVVCSLPGIVNNKVTTGAHVNVICKPGGERQQKVIFLEETNTKNMHEEIAMKHLAEWEELQNKFIKIINCKYLIANKLRSKFKLKANHSLQRYSGVCDINCGNTVTWCYPRLTKEFLYSTGIILVLRDLIVILALGISNYCIYRFLYNRNTMRMLKSQTIVRRRQTLTMLVVLAMVLIILVLPKDILYITYILSMLFNPPGLELTKSIKSINLFLKILQSFNSVCNVFVYARLHTFFRKEVNKLSKRAHVSLRTFIKQPSRRTRFSRDEIEFVLSRQLNMKHLAETNV